MAQPQSAPQSSTRLAPGCADRALAELVAIARDSADWRLVQFRSRAGAEQYRRLYRLIARYLVQNPRVLDWGAGNGHFSYFLLRAGFDVTAFSLKSPTPRQLLPQGSYRFVRGDRDEPEQLPFADESFDAVTSIGVLEHVRETAGTRSGRDRATDRQNVYTGDRACSNIGAGIAIGVRSLFRDCNAVVDRESVLIDRLPDALPRSASGNA